MALEAELRTDTADRADQFVALWVRLQMQSERAYVSGDVEGRKAIQTQMAGMARSLERDPQMESILAARKAQLGIAIETGRRLGAELAFNNGIDWGRGRTWRSAMASLRPIIRRSSRRARSPEGGRSSSAKPDAHYRYTAVRGRPLSYVTYNVSAFSSAWRAPAGSPEPRLREAAQTPLRVEPLLRCAGPPVIVPGVGVGFRRGKRCNRQTAPPIVTADPSAII